MYDTEYTDENLKSTEQYICRSIINTVLLNITGILSLLLLLLLLISQI